MYIYIYIIYILYIFILHNNQGTKIKKRLIFMYQGTTLYENVLPTTKESTTTFLLLRKVL